MPVLLWPSWLDWWADEENRRLLITVGVSLALHGGALVGPTQLWTSFTAQAVLKPDVPMNGMNAPETCNSSFPISNKTLARLVMHVDFSIFPKTGNSTTTACSGG